MYATAPDHHISGLTQMHKNTRPAPLPVMIVWDQISAKVAYKITISRKDGIKLLEKHATTKTLLLYLTMF
jgi:hypothetical protein